MAQSSTNFDGRWYILDNGGATHVSATFAIQDSLGQLAVDSSTGATAKIAPGFLELGRAVGEANPAAGDNYEADNSCATARPIDITGAAQTHNFHVAGDQDWLKFNVTAGVKYRIEVEPPVGSPADVVAELYADCAAAPTANSGSTFGGVRLDIDATVNGEMHMKLANVTPAVAGANVTYRVNVRNILQAASLANDAAIVVAGRLKANDALQANILHIAGQVVQLLQTAGYSADQIQYLTTDPGQTGFDAPPTLANLQNALITWAPSHVAASGMLTLYLIDHGNPGLFYLDEVNGQRITPADLNTWLSQLEQAVPKLRINVFIEACESGSFITGSTSISHPGRVIVTSTNDQNVAYASAEGAHFSDRFISALREGRHILSSFDEGAYAVRNFEQQRPWIDANGDGVPNTFEDAPIASQRWFIYDQNIAEASRLYAPFVVNAHGPSAISNGTGALQAQVRDNTGAEKVWAVIYPPSYTGPTNSSELVPENTPRVELTRQSGDGKDGVYAVNFTQFTENGVYRIVFHAQDTDKLVARPVVIEVNVQDSTQTQIFLPQIQR